MYNKDMRLNFYFSLNVNGKWYILMEKKMKFRFNRNIF